MDRNICTVPLHDHENGISIWYHVIVNNQLNRVNLTKCYIIFNLWLETAIGNVGIKSEDFR